MAKNSTEGNTEKKKAPPIKREANKKTRIIIIAKLASNMISWTFLYVIAMYLNGIYSKNTLTLFFIITLAAIMVSTCLEDYPEKL